MSVQHHYVECECDSAEHVVRLSADTQDQTLPLWLEVHLVHWRPWYVRVWVAIKYVFGYKSKYGDFDTCCLNREEANKFVSVIRKVYAE